MLQKLTAFSLSLLICFSLLPSQAGAMDAPEDESPVQVEDVENQTSPENPDAGIAPCYMVNDFPELPPGVDVTIGGDTYGGGGTYGGGSIIG